jgi:hypothetical protein
VDPVRDLARDDPWLDSLERSRARREQSGRSSTRRRRLRYRRIRALAAAGTGLAVIMVVAIVLPGLGGGGTAHRARAVEAASFAPRVGGPLASNPPVTARHRPAAPRSGGSSCRPGTDVNGYTNPLASAQLTGERIDQGVDYAGTGTLAALGAGRLTYVATSATGWPGSFIEYRLSTGAAAGCFVYYAEGVRPIHGLRVGQTVKAGQTIAQIIPGWPTGIELGWGSGQSTITSAAKHHQWSPRSDADSKPTAAGKSFSALVVALGGPAGKSEG